MSSEYDILKVNYDVLNFKHNSLKTLLQNKVNLYEEKINEINAQLAKYKNQNKVHRNNFNEQVKTIISLIEILEKTNNTSIESLAKFSETSNLHEIKEGIKIFIESNKGHAELRKQIIEKVSLKCST